ncbi:MAG: NADH-quinone oxidoreductase subunit J [Candidatus Firestonebacteria bacterium]
MLLFPVFAIIAIIAALLVVTLKSTMHCALFLALFLLSVSGIFFTLDADFLGIVQILVYVGGIIVLILFAVMLTSKVQSTLLEQTNSQKVPAVLISLALIVILSVAAFKTFLPATFYAAEPGGTIRETGRLLMTVYVLPFELASIILLVALIGAILLAGKRGE